MKNAFIESEYTNTLSAFDNVGTNFYLYIFNRVNRHRRHLFDGAEISV